MTFMPRLPTAADRALDLADAVLQRARAEGPPPGLSALPPRSRSAYDRMVDAMNRLPRPLMVLGSLALLGSALIAPDWFATRMDTLSRMPEALWWIIGAVVSLHFGGRYQERAQDFRRETATGAPVPLDPAPATPGPDAETALAVLSPGPNPALAAWRVACP
jgi:hypothetical protein